MALVYTALADSFCELLLWGHAQSLFNGAPLSRQFDIGPCLGLVLVSTGLYGFGMSLNDIIDRRKDREISPHRPLPSGRIGVGTAHVVCALLALMALAGAEEYSAAPGHNHMSLVLVVFTGSLITSYDFASKYLVVPGLLSLGLIRFFHASIAAPSLPVIWHPLFLLNHVTILSAVCYHWEKKRPVLQPSHWRSIIFGLIGLDLLAILLQAWRRSANMFPPQTSGGFDSIVQVLDLRPALLLPLAAAVVFVGMAFWIRRRSATPRDAGQTLMLAGLLWLIVYDALFAGAYVRPLAGVLILILLPIAYVSVIVMRWWSKLVQLSQRPDFKRVETPSP